MNPTNSKVPGPTRAWLAWVLVLNGIWAIFLRFRPMSESAAEETDAPGLSSFVLGLADRALASPYYNFMIVSFLASAFFGVFVWMSVSGHFANTATRLIGTATPRQDELDGTYSQARAPLREAAAIFTGLGFLGTVYGISIAINGLKGVLNGGDPDGLISGLRTAFDTTFIGLVASLILTVGLMTLDQHARSKLAKPG